MSSDQLNTGPSREIPSGIPYPPDGPMRTLTDPSVFFLYPYIAGMTVMHDSIAATVDEHSTFREHPIPRLGGTIDSAMTLVFGREDEALETAERIYNMHTHMDGANDGALQTLVLNSVFNGTVQAHERWAGPVEDKEGLWRDYVTFSKFFGIPDGQMPQDIDEQAAYWEELIQGDALLQTDVSKRVVHDVFRFKREWLPRPLNVVGQPAVALGQAVAISALDPRLQDRADLHLSKKEERMVQGFDAAMQHTYGKTPASVRQLAIPAYLGGKRMVATTQNELEMFHDVLPDPVQDVARTSLRALRSLGQTVTGR